MGIPSSIVKRVAEGRYSYLQAGLKGARIYKSPEEYIYSTILNSIIISVFLGGMVLFSFWFLLKVSLIYAIPSALIIALVLGYVFYSFSLRYPSLTAKERARKIDVKLPHAVAFLLALSKGGFSPIQMFRDLGERGDEYGEVSKEAIEVVRGAENFGYSPPRALLEVADSTPSDRFREFLMSLATVVETGSGMEEFLAKKCEEYYSLAKAEGTRALDQIALYAELYVILLGLGPFLLAVVWIPVSMMSGISFLPVLLVTYLFIPIGSLLFLIMLDKFSPMEVRKRRRGERRIGLKKALRSPFKSFSEDPELVLGVSAPLAASFAAYRLSSGFLDETTVILSLIIFLLPFTIFHEIRKKRIERIVAATPAFLDSFSAAVSSGLPPAKAIKTLPPERFGPLSHELKLVRRDTEWGGSISEAFAKMEKRIRSGLLSRVVSVMERVSKATAKIDSMLHILSRDVSTEIFLKRERVGATFLYVLIIYMIFGLTNMCGMMIVLLSPLYVDRPGGEEFMGGFTIGGLDPEMMRIVFFHLTIFQAICMGLVAGKFRTGSMLDGLKHSLFMLILGWVAFAVALPFFREAAKGIVKL